VWAGDKNPATCDAASEALGIAVESDYQARVPGADDAERGALANYGYSFGMFRFLRHGDDLDSGERVGGRDPLLV
jgi:hypothetical protein